MSWDIVLFNLTRKVSSAEEISEDILIPMATNGGFKKILTEYFPDIKWEDNCGIISRDNVYIELFTGQPDEETFSNIIFFLREGEASIFEVIGLCKKYGWQLYDTSLGEMIDTDHPERNGYTQYSAYVTHINGLSSNAAHRST